MERKEKGMVERIAAEGFLPGEFISEELDERGWSQADLAEIIGKTPGMVNELIKGKRKVTPDIAEGLAAAFGTSAEYWTNLETAYQYWLLRRHRDQPPISQRKARLMSIAPYRELIRRGWIEPSNDIDVLEENVLTFLGMHSVDDTPAKIPHVARKSTSYAEVPPALYAYLRKARHIARGVHAQPFDIDRLRAALPNLKTLCKNCEDVRLIPKLLAEAGVRLVIVEHLAGTKVDGATLRLEDGSPVIVLSLRYDRIDSFWHTLMHEIGHILNEDWEIVDSNLVGEDATASDEKPASESKADESAVEFLVPQALLQTFVNNHSPLYYARDIQGFALSHQVHPGIVVGQLHHVGELKYNQFREFLDKVRVTITDSALTDGWGAVISGV
jgi:HTH-type transcriptional regulator/antitoxin HigA